MSVAMMEQFLPEIPVSELPFLDLRDLGPDQSHELTYSASPSCPSLTATIVEQPDEPEPAREAVYSPTKDSTPRRQHLPILCKPVPVRLNDRVQDRPIKLKKSNRGFGHFFEREEEEHRKDGALIPNVSREISMKQEMQLPDKRYGRFLRNLRWTFFSVYRRLCAVVIVANVVTMIVLGANNGLFRTSTSVSHISTAISVNLVITVLLRQELIVNALYIITCQLPQSLPLKLRHLAAKVYHYGGIHSGAGISALLWFLLFNNAVSQLCRTGRVASSYRIAILFFMGVIDASLTLVVAFSEPRLRALIHNVWEMTHRFAGWVSIIAFWVLFGLLAKVQAQQEKSSTGRIFAQSPTFWCLMIISVSLILPWLRLRRVPVESVCLSDHAIRLRFKYTNFPAGAAQKFSYDGLREFHPFAGISELDDGPDTFSTLVSKAGDWTQRTIQQPPRKLWKRGIPMRGVICVAALFRRVVFVATGSGIGPVLSVLSLRNRFSCRIIWSTREPEATYQKEIVHYVKDVDPQAIIINTTKVKNPDLVQEAYQLYRILDAEAVFIISNPKVTRKVVYDLECRGVPIFGVIFDS